MLSICLSLSLGTREFIVYLPFRMKLLRSTMSVESESARLVQIQPPRNFHLRQFLMFAQVPQLVFSAT